MRWARAPASPTPLPGPATPFAPRDATGAASAPALEQPPGPFACPLCLPLARGLSPVSSTQRGGGWACQGALEEQQVWPREALVLQSMKGVS